MYIWYWHHTDIILELTKRFLLHNICFNFLNKQVTTIIKVLKKSFWRIDYFQTSWNFTFIPFLCFLLRECTTLHTELLEIFWIITVSFRYWTFLPLTTSASLAEVRDPLQVLMYYLNPPKFELIVVICLLPASPIHNKL